VVKGAEKFHDIFRVSQPNTAYNTHTRQTSVYGRFFSCEKLIWLLNIGCSRTTFRYPFRSTVTHQVTSHYLPQHGSSFVGSKACRFFFFFPIQSAPKNSNNYVQSIIFEKDSVQNLNSGGLNKLKEHLNSPTSEARSQLKQA